MLLGQYNQKVASKNRIAVPVKFRKDLGDRLIISQGFENSLLLLEPKSWQKLISGAVVGPFTTGAVRNTLRFLIGGAVEIELDWQGRFVLPSHLKKFARIEKEVVFVGLLNWVEVWSARDWIIHSKKIANESSAVAEKLKEIGG